MEKYEYKSLYKRNGVCIDEELNKLGQEGWKLVGIRQCNDSSHIHLMRNISPERTLTEELNALKEKVKKLSEEYN